ncbi:DUF2513 domain-containing protein [Rhodoblastus sp.]|uniref:DUF2513 domain-containing protein n=1 Tax=Rhodoblastus sp. TaxID=1962975 RepID=UPI0035B08397
MKRDMDLIRELLLKLEALPMRPGGVVTISPDAEEIAVAGHDVEQIEYHLSLILEAGLIEQLDVHPMFGISFRRLSWQGHDFLDSVRDPRIWEKTKKGAEAAGGFTVDLLKDLAKGFIKKQVEEYTGVKIA